MKKSSCPRFWEVEAARDARLSGEELARHERHVAECEACARERESLERMASLLRADDPMDEVSFRRLRGSLLEAAHSPPPRRARPVRWLALSAAAIAVVVAVFLSLRPVAPDATPVTVIAATPVGAAEFTRQDTPSEHRIDLTDGTLDVAVERPPGALPVRVRVPDGEIEDLGTRFRVEVRDRRTQALEVSVGAVSFRRVDGFSVRVVAGERWAAKSRTAENRVSPTPAPEHPAVVRTPAESAHPTAKSAEPAPTPAPSAEPGDAAGAARAEEDAAYLHVIALLREGRQAEAKLAAKDYLRRFPTGFRRPEMEEIAR